jgi:hypothetical protein
MDECPLCGAEVEGRYLRCPECGAACWLNGNEARAELIARIRSEGGAAETSELAKIDFLLEALQQAQARGELTGSAYLLLTRRYLERARELGREPSGDAQATPAAASDETIARPAPARPAPLAGPTPRPSAPPGPPSRIAVAARSVPWTVWVALAGALLVIAAAAGFAIYAWPSLAAGIRLSILVALTAVFYGGGLWLRRRLAVIGTSLLAIGAALVLVDGWLLLSAAGLHSLWWWTLLFAVGSGVHWEMGVWLRVRLFAVSGAIAQIAWWWLLGTALSWPLGARAAILTTVGLIWTLAAPHIRRGAAESIGQVLGLAGPGLAAGAAAVAIVGVLLDPGWSAVIVALVIAVTATAALELQRVSDRAWVREVSVVALLPVPVVLLSLPTTVPTWPVIVLMVVAGAFFLLVSARRGGTLRAAAGLVTLLAAPTLPGLMGDGGSGPWIGAVASWLGLGTLAVVAGSLLRRMAPRGFERGIRDVSRVMEVGGWLTLLGASVVQIAALGVAEPLMAGELPSSGALTLLAAEAAAAWLVSTAVRSRVEPSVAPEEMSHSPILVLLTATGLAGYAFSQFAAALAVRWIAPGADHVWYSFVMLGLAAAWSHSRTLAMRRLGVSSGLAAWMFGLSSIGSVVFAIAPALVGSAAPGARYILLALLAAALWGLEAWRFGERIFVLAAFLAASATIYPALWGIGGRAAAGLVTAVAGAVLALAPLALRRKVEWRVRWSLGAAIASAAGVLGAFSTPWSATLGLAALAAALVGPALLGLPVLAGPSAFVAFAAVCSLESWAGAGAWAGTAVAIAAAAAMLTPAVVHRGQPQPRPGATWSLALAGALALASVLVATVIARLGSAPPDWLAGGEWSIAVLLCALAAYCAGWSRSARTKWGLAAGSFLLLAGLLMFLGAADVGVPEAYLIVVAVWGGVVAWRLSQRKRYQHAATAIDIVALIAGLAGPALLMMAAGLGVSSTNHAIWLICLAAAVVASGVGLHVRLYLGCGLGGAVLAAFWLTSSHLSAIPAVVAIVAVVGGALITLGAVGERRRARLTMVAKNAFAGWR